MTVVFVHGVPETSEVWKPLHSHLHRSDVSLLKLPGFGCPRPEGFGASKEDYLAWLIAELESLQSAGPIDLVGHDWGGGLVVRLVSVRPDLVRSWTTDAAALGDPGYQWHDAARIMQTPGAGEELLDQLLAIPEHQRGGFFHDLGVPADRTSGLAYLDQTMADCILALYRSAIDIGSEWAPEFHDIPCPGLVLVPAHDPYLPAANTRTSAARAGARIVELPERGHWWMLQDPAQGAALLQQFWASLSAPVH